MEKQNIGIAVDMITSYWHIRKQKGKTVFIG